VWWFNPAAAAASAVAAAGPVGISIIVLRQTTHNSSNCCRYCWRSKEGTTRISNFWIHRGYGYRGCAFKLKSKLDESWQNTSLVTSVNFILSLYKLHM
jgi:hypothetical protein